MKAGGIAEESETMNIEHYRVFIHGKEKTADIVRIEEEPYRWCIEFASRHKVYTYAKKRNIVRVQKRSKSEILMRKREKIVKKNLGYFKALAQQLFLSDNANEETASFNFTAKQYNWLHEVPKHSSLHLYLAPMTMNQEQEDQQCIFPFGFNLSQFSATEKALNYPISVIEGPPGTGKTQTILNIIANILMQKKTVAIVSSNNAAIKNVYDKLVAYDLGWITAFLGSQENKTAFLNNQPEYPVAWDNLIPKTALQEQQDNIIQQTQAQKQKLMLQNELALCKQSLRELQTEHKHFYAQMQQRIKPLTYKSTHPLTSQETLAFSATLESLKRNRVSLFAKLKNLMRFGVYSFSFYKNSTSHIITFLHSQFYSLREEELVQKIDNLEKQLESFTQEGYGLSDHALELLKSTLSYRYNLDSSRKQFDEDFIRTQFASFIEEYPVILSTTHSLRNCVTAGYLFDYLIIDEASQVDILSGALALSCAKRAVIVGDDKQLPPVITADTQQKLQQMNQSPPHKALQYDNSLLTSVILHFDGYNLPKTLLQEHYRCHPKIIDFCNKKFYNNQLIILTKEKDNNDPLVLYNTSQGNHQRGGRNQRELDVINNDILPCISDSQATRGIVSPFRAQVQAASKQIDSNLGFEIDTVHKYQGREQDIMILTTVASSTNRFADDPKLLNVAISRAVKQLYVVTSGHEDNPNMRDLIDYMEYNNYNIIDSKVISIFDLLYREYAPQLEAFKKRMHTSGNVSEYDSENAMKLCIQDVLKDADFSHIAWVTHYQLRNILKDTSLLESDRERQFVSNPQTHVDFLLYNKWSKQPVMAVEVDGTTFHNNKAQQERDALKDVILARYGVPLERFATDGSSEHKRLRVALQRALATQRADG